jgi:hypothetical protein
MSRVIQWSARTLIIAVALVVLGWVLGLAFPADRITEEATGMVDRLGLPLLSAFLLAAPLAFPISRSRLSGRALFGAALLAVFGLMTVLTQVEAALFLDMTPKELLIGTVTATITSLALAWLAVARYPRPGTASTGVHDRPNPPTTASWVCRWIGVSLAYMVLYIIAGLLILPTIRPWYEAQGTLDANPALVFPLQIVRGALFVAFVLPLLRSMRVTRWQASLAMAVMIPLVHGVAVLIPPNPFMPAYVRHAHMIEIGWSNFVLGLLIGFLFWNPSPGAQPVVTGVTAAVLD